MKDTLATIIRERFERSGMSMLQLSKRTGVPYGSVHRFFASQNDNAALGTAQKFCDVLGLTLHDKKG